MSFLSDSRLGNGGQMCKNFKIFKRVNGKILCAFASTYAI